MSKGYYLDHCTDPISVYNTNPGIEDMIPYGCIGCSWSELIEYIYIYIFIYYFSIYIDIKNIKKKIILFIIIKIIYTIKTLKKIQISNDNILSTIFPTMYLASLRWFEYPKLRGNAGEIMFKLCEKFGYYDC